MLALRAGELRPDARSVASVAATLAVASMATFVQSFVLLKLAFILLFVASAALGVAAARKLVAYPRLVVFYALLAAAGMAWSIVGLFHHGNHVTGVADALRLYAVWSAAFLLLFTLLRAEPSRGLRPLHLAMVTAGILIAAVNLFGLVDQILGWGLMSDAVRVELDQFIGIHDGYVQITSQNIGTLFLIVPYLLFLQLRADAGAANTWVTRAALAVCLLLTLLSGRRALWLAVAFSPFTILALTLATGSLQQLHRWARRGLLAYCAIGVLGAGLVVVLPDRGPAIGGIEYLKAAFSSQDERSIQRPHLVDGFKEAPVLGSGFGAAVRYLRDYERPWTGYELTYFQMLFNLGSVGVLLLGSLFASYLWLVLRTIRRHREGSAVPMALLVAFCSLLVGAYSNRYFGSFDLLFFVGLLPYLATFSDGFGPSRPEAA
jgi:hypothetical protein